MSTHGSLSEVELFNLLYKSSFNKVCNFACFYVRNKQVSEDITMDAFLQLLETMKVESVDNPMALLITIVKHKSLDYLKTQVRRENTKLQTLGAALSLAKTGLKRKKKKLPTYYSNVNLTKKVTPLAWP